MCDCGEERASRYPAFDIVLGYPPPDIHLQMCACIFAMITEIPAKKWGDTEIAEGGRSVLVMRARYRSAGLIPHQRGWTVAG